MSDILSSLATDLGLPVYLVFIVLAWSIIWKGLALWKSARKNHKIWFVILLVIQTMGILEILYVFLFSEIKLPNVEEKRRKRKRR